MLLLDGLAEPFALSFLAEVRELEPHRRRIDVAKARDDVRPGPDVEAECERGDELQVGLGDAVKLRQQLRGATWW